MGKVAIEYPDIQLDPSYFLTPEAAAMYGLGPEATPNDVLLHIPGYVGARMFRGWEMIAAFWDPVGPFTWTAPDLFWGAPYKAGVLVAGAGGSGAAMVYTSGSSSSNGVTGGASGYIETDIIWVNPGQVYHGVVGAQGAPVAANTNRPVTVDGNNGGASSFNGLIAEGGQGGVKCDFGRYINTQGAVGAQCSSVAGSNCNPFGGTVVPMEENSSVNSISPVQGKPAACYDPFRNKALLGAGGWAIPGTPGKTGQGGKDPYGNPYGGDGAEGASTTVYGAYAHQGGCGGGAAVAMNGTAVSGAGGVGFVHIYVQGVIAP